ncbi:MAG: pyruvate dehydrogenase (acetyl-transferring) E1 component subunit alpha [Candidatus Latescibacterota bacterium]|nr:MAG: pyruvate dehydrogenase (acetyl-transferring) E1 component subunit alpha [Candidatus Latescibacterota bacterium]
MYTIRQFEEKARQLFRQGLIYGALHPYVGQEAVAVGACAALENDDFVVSTHRGHGHCIAKGADLKRMMAELLGRETGYSKGRGGSMHMFSVEEGLLGGNGIVGGGLPIALGSAFSAQYRQSGQVTLCFFGEGAASNGTFHESMNLASLWKLPVVYICENNLYAATTPVSDSAPIENIADRASAYGCPGLVVDGNDVVSVYEAVQQAVARARAGEGPTLIECKTFRFYPHCMVIPEHRRKAEVEEWRRKDPIVRFEKRLLEEHLMTHEEQEKIKREVENAIEEAVNFAKESRYPGVETVADGVWA